MLTFISKSCGGIQIKLLGKRKEPWEVFGRTTLMPHSTCYESQLLFPLSEVYHKRNGQKFNSNLNFKLHAGIRIKKFLVRFENE